MSSTNKTALLDLNQWVASDPVLREDFNADNSKIDAALGAMSYERIMDVTTTAAATVISLDLSDIDWSKYLRVDIFADGLVSSYDDSSWNVAAATAKLNGVNTTMYYGHLNTNRNGEFSSPYTSSYLMEVAPVRFSKVSEVAGKPRGGSSCVSIIPCGSCGSFSLLVKSHYVGVNSSNEIGGRWYDAFYHVPPGTLTLSGLLSLDYYYSSQTLNAGANFKIYGVKK